MNTLLNKKELALCKEIALCEMMINSTKRITNPLKQDQVQRVVAKWQVRLDKAREQVKAL